MPLNRRGDGPFAYADPEALDRIDATKFLFDAVIENDELNGGSISDWGSAEDVVATYLLVEEDPETLRPIESRRDPGPRGKMILEHLIATGDADQAREMLHAWIDEHIGA